MPQSSVLFHLCITFFLAAARRHPGRASWIFIQETANTVWSILINLVALCQALITAVWGCGARVRIVAILAVLVLVGHDTAFGGWSLVFLGPLLWRKVRPGGSAGQWVFPQPAFVEVAFEARLSLLTDSELEQLINELTQALEPASDEGWPDLRPDVYRQREIASRVRDQRRAHRRARRWLQPDRL